MEQEEPPRKPERFTSHLLLSNDDILALGIPEAKLELFRRMRYQAAFGIESWYDDLKEHTFYTKPISLSYAEAQALSKYHYTVSTAEHRVVQSMTDEENELVRNLEERIDQAIKNDERLVNGAFIKLDTRSPKDVVLYDQANEQVQELVRKELAALYADKRKQKLGAKEQAQEDITHHPTGKIDVGAEERDENAETSAFVVATSRALKIRSGREALYLLAKSDRISEDLNKILPFGEQHFSINLILREWLDEVIERPQYEFRAFVHQNQLNAMSQYFCFCKYDDLIEREEEVKQSILAFHESVKDRISHSSYVIDFYLKKNGDVLIIELNPFHNGAGAALFSWTKDRERFLHGPFELRITKELTTNPKDILPPFWVRFIDGCFAARQKGKSAGGGNKEEEGKGCSLC